MAANPFDMGSGGVSSGMADGCLIKLDSLLKNLQDLRGNLKKLSNDKLDVMVASVEGAMKMYKDERCDLVQKIEASKARIDLLEKQLETRPMENIGNSAGSYASVAKQHAPLHPPKKDPLCVVRVVPKVDPQTGEFSTLSSEATKKAITRIKLVGTGVGVTNVWKTGNKGVAVSCRTREEANKLAGLINQQMPTDFLAEKQEQINPKVTILLTDEEYADKSNHSELLDDILDRNVGLENTSENPLKIVHSFLTKNRNSIVVLEIGAKNYQQIKASGNRIMAGFENARVKERDPVSQCFNCQRFGHKAIKCRFQIDGKNAKRCQRCGGDHSVKLGCTAPKCCANCAENNKHSRRNPHPTDHEASDRKCPMRLSAEKHARKFICYND